MLLSVIVPSIDGTIPQSIPDDPRLEVVVVKGVRPVGRARNMGLLRAKGDYIAWVDADDEITPDWLPSILDAIETAPDVVTFDAELIGWKDRGNCVWGVSSRAASIERLRRDVYRDILRPSMLWLYVTRRSLWDGLLFDEDMKIAEDYLLLPKVLERAASCVYVPRMLYRYICRMTSLVNTQDFEATLDLMRQWGRRLEEAPRQRRGECLWGMAVSCYWICDRVALDRQTKIDPYAVECARRCRSAIFMSMGSLMHEVFVEHDLSIGERVCWYLRFFSAAADWWWPQRLKRFFKGSI